MHATGSTGHIDLVIRTARQPSWRGGGHATAAFDGFWCHIRAGFVLEPVPALGAAQAAGSITLHKRVCPAGTTGNVFDECHDNCQGNRCRSHWMAVRRSSLMPTGT